MFTEKELAYLKSQKLARIATVATDEQPDVTPVGFEFDGTAFYIGGRNNPNTRKFKNIEGGQNKVALVIDDLASVDPWRPRGIRIYGTAGLVEHSGYAGEGMYIRITPQVSWSWGVESRPVHKIVHSQNQQVG